MRDSDEAAFTELVNRHLGLGVFPRLSRDGGGYVATFTLVVGPWAVL